MTSTGPKDQVWARSLRRPGPLASILWAVALLALAALPARAQVLTGVLVDDSTGVGVEGATITVLLDNLRLNSTITDPDGRFFLYIPGEGVYRLEAERLGYATTESQAIPVVPEDSIEVEFRIRQEAIILNPLVVTAGGNSGRFKFERHMEEWGKGVFFTPEMVDSIGPRHPMDILRDRDDTWLTWQMGARRLIPSVRSFLGSGCVTYMLDGMQVRAWPSGGRGIWENSQLEFILGPDIVAAEYYRYIGEVPEEWRQLAGGDSMCGLLALWTEAGW
jgi:hypothetical protein